MNDNRHILFFIRVYSFQGQSIEQDPNNPQAINSHIGFLFFDIALLKVYTGLIKGTSKIDQIDRFKSLLMHVKPVECVTIFAEKAHQTIQILKNMPVKPQLSYMTQDDIYDKNETVIKLWEHFEKQDISHLCEGQLLALGLCSRYLDKMMLTEATLPFFEFHSYQREFV